MLDHDGPAPGPDAETETAQSGWPIAWAVVALLYTVSAVVYYVVATSGLS